MDELLTRFNNRESIAFGKVYLLYHKELNLYATSLYRDCNIESEDVVHDIFMSIWSSNIKFTTVESIKGYVYVSIKNGFKSFIHHNNYVRKYQKYIEDDSSYETGIIECEIYSLVDETLKLLPETYGKVLKMYIDGWKSGEIATALGRTEQNIYNIKHEIISDLRKKLPKDKLLFINMLLN